MTESRIKKTLLNARVNLIFYFISLIISFFSRKIFLNCLGDNFVGLTGTIQNLLGFLNLAELGIGTAVGYLLYKPIYEKDHQSINEIISVMGYLYRWVGIVIFSVGVILSGFFPLIFPSAETGFDLLVIYSVYYTFIITSVISYFNNYQQALLGADQRNYIISAYHQTFNIIIVLTQLIAVYFTRSYYLWAAIQFAFGITYTIVLNRKIYKTYPWLKSDVKLGRGLLKKYPDVLKKSKQIFIHRINISAQYQVSSLLIYAFVSLKIVAYYSNYTIIIDKVFILVNSVIESIKAGVGNLIAEGKNQKIFDIFYENATMRFFIGGVISTFLFILTEPFISVWLGDKYLLGSTTLSLIILRIYLQLTIGSVEPFINGYGLFSDVWAPLAQTAIFIVTSLILGSNMGLNGILISVIISLFLIQGIWKPYYLYRSGFKQSVWNYWIYWIGLNALNITSIIAITHIIRHYLSCECAGYIDWLIYSIKSSVIIIPTFILLYLAFVKSARRMTLRLIKR